jgi:isopentenyl phosphate kinase
MRDLLLLKIGGSVCTEKSGGKFKVRAGAVGKIGEEIAQARREKDFRLLVVNGAGPFGHVNVAKYDINDGLSEPKDFEGFVKTICDCDFLNWKVSEILRTKGLNVIPYPCSNVVIQAGKKITSLNTDVINKLWDHDEDIIPVLNGTMVPDTELKGSVVSGDAIIEHLAGRMNASSVIFASDVDGVFNADPNKHKNAELIERITKENFNDLKSGLGGSSNTDVTGGMLRKVEKILDSGTETLIVNGNVTGRVRDALLGRSVKGTVIKP